ncbi:MAG: 3-oxoacyl-ACP synthase [Chloroflexi bacterium]|nr:3-oxoacyl-ACP synthase [Chloroflexota bacterium]
MTEVTLVRDEVGIVSAGAYIPQSFISAAEMARATGIPEEIIRTKFGLNRKPIPGPNDHTNAMALWAAQDALAQTSIKPQDIDVVLCTTEEWKEYPLWTAGIKLAYDLGATRAWAIDVQMRCATTMATMKMAKAMMLSDPDVNTVLIAGGYRNGDFVDFSNPRSRFLIDLSCGGGAILLQKNYPRNRLLESVVRVDGSFSLDVIVPAGGTVKPISAEALALHEYRLDVPDPEGMKRRLDKLSMENFVGVVDAALAKSGLTRKDIGYLNILHMKRSAFEYVLQELGLTEEQSFYLSDYGHIGQQDQALSIKKGLELGRLRDGMVMVMVAAGIGYAWSASVVKWG